MGNKDHPSILEWNAQRKVCSAWGSVEQTQGDQANLVVLYDFP